MESGLLHHLNSNNWRIPHQKPAKMDQTDRKLVAILQQNGRVSLSELGHYLRISKAGISHRLSRLKEKGIIRGYTTHINITRFPGTHTIYFLHHTRQSLTRWTALLSARSDTVMVLSHFGEANTLVWTYHASTASRELFRKWVSSQHATIVHEWGVSQMHLFPLNYCNEKTTDFFSSRHRSSGFISYFKQVRPEPHHITTDELAIMRHLQSDARTPLIELEKRTGIKRTTIKQIIRNLITHGIINEFSATVNPYAIDSITYCTLTAKFDSEDERQSFRQWLGRQGNANMLISLTEPGHCLAFIYFTSLAQITTFEDELRMHFHSLKTYSLLAVREEQKLDWLPEDISTTLANEIM